LAEDLGAILAPPEAMRSDFYRLGGQSRSAFFGTAMP
jgi:hypothetical protein